ncbi:MAG: right-handed parallel beta-helix repeat-containing protein [Geminicoccaceae bacterium]
MRLLHLTGASIVVIGAMISCPADASDGADASAVSGWLELGGYRRFGAPSRGEIAGFLPFLQSDTALGFVEMRGKRFSDSGLEGNLAVGARRMLAGGWNAGGWAGFDLREAELGGWHRQMAGGFELLGDSFDIRANGYMPLDATRSTRHTQEVSATMVAGSTIVPSIIDNGGALVLGSGGFTTTTVTDRTLSRRELALHGFDAEIGARMPVERMGIDRDRFDLRGYVGGFRFDHDDLDQPVSGPRARLEWRIDGILPAMPASRLTFEGAWSRDDHRHSLFEAGVRLRIPLAFADLPATGGHPRDLHGRQVRRLVEAVERDTDILVETSLKVIASETRTSMTGTPYTEEAVIDPQTTTPLDHVVLVDGSGDLAGEAAAAGERTLYVVQGGAGDHGAVAMPENVTVIGGGTTIDLQGAVSGTTVSYTAPGTRGRIVETGAGSALAVGSGTHVKGLELMGGGGRTVAIAANNGLSIAAGASNLHIEGNSIGGFGDTGIVTGNAARAIDIVDNDISSVNSAGIAIGAGGYFIFTTANRVNDAGTGILLDGSSTLGIEVADNIISNIDIGIDLQDASSPPFTTGIYGNVIRSAGVAGLRFAGTTNSDLSWNVLGGTMPVAIRFEDGVHSFYSGGNTSEAGASIGDACSRTAGAHIDIRVEFDGVYHDDGNC